MTATRHRIKRTQAFVPQEGASNSFYAWGFIGSPFRLGVLLNVRRTLPFLLSFLLLTAASAQTVRVQQTQGSMHGFLVIRSEGGVVLGSGDLIQSAHGSRLTIELALRFHDGSIDDETAEYTQSGAFRFLSDHLVQRGPYFPKPIDLRIDADGRITNRTRDKNGKDQVETEQLNLPPNLANGILGILLLNVPPNTPGIHLAMVLPSAKPRLATLDITSTGEHEFAAAGVPHKATVFQVKINLGGVASVVAPMIGKQPADAYVWVLEGVAPNLIRVQEQLYESGPVVSIELAGTTYPTSPAH